MFDTSKSNETNSATAAAAAAAIAFLQKTKSGLPLDLMTPFSHAAPSAASTTSSRASPLESINGPSAAAAAAAASQWMNYPPTPQQQQQQQQFVTSNFDNFLSVYLPTSATSTSGSNSSTPFHMTPHVDSANSVMSQPNLFAVAATAYSNLIGMNPYQVCLNK